MASHTPAKRQFSEAFNESSMKEESGYVSSVTPVKTSRKINRYFNAKLQTDTKEYRVVSYNVEKHEDFVKADKLGSPVKITNFKLNPGLVEGDFDLIFNRYCKIEHLQKLNFKRKIVFDKESDSSITDTQFTAIGDVDFSITRKSYNVTAKVLSFCDEKHPVSLYGSTKYVQDVLIADETGRIKLNLWEDMIDKVIEGKTYQFKNVSTRNFNNLPSLTTTMATSVHIVDDLEETSDLVVMTNKKITHGKIQQIQCIQKVKCGACQKSLELPEEDSKRIKCAYCNLKSNVATLQQTLTCRINIEDSKQNLLRLVCFQTTMQAFLKEQNREELIRNMDQLEDYLLDIPSVTCVHGEGTEVISSLTIE